MVGLGCGFCGGPLWAVGAGCRVASVADRITLSLEPLVTGLDPILLIKRH